LQRLSINLSDKPGPIGKNRKPTMMEYIRNPHYRIFFWHSNEDLNKKLIIYLGTKTSVYTPVLGLAHCLTNFGFKGIAEINSEEDDAIIQTVIPKSKLIEFDYKYLLDNEIYLQEQSMYPLEMNTQREVTKRDSILFDLNGKSMKAKTNEYFQAIFNNQQIAIMLM
jgi:CRISPR-associated protein Cas5h